MSIARMVKRKLWMLVGIGTGGLLRSCGLSMKCFGFGAGVGDSTASRDFETASVFVDREGQLGGCPVGGPDCVGGSNRRRSVPRPRLRALWRS